MSNGRKRPSIPAGYRLCEHCKGKGSFKHRGEKNPDPCLMCNENGYVSIDGEQARILAKLVPRAERHLYKQHVFDGTPRCKTCNGYGATPSCPGCGLSPVLLGLEHNGDLSLATKQAVVGGKIVSLDGPRDTLRSPNMIDVLLHCHVFPVPHPRFHAPAVQEALHILEVRGMIEIAREGHGMIDPLQPVAYRTTAGGQMLVQALCDVPFPVKKWSMP